MKVTSKRRLPSARAVMWSVLAPSSTRNARNVARQRPTAGTDSACRSGCPRPLRPRWRPAAGRARRSSMSAARFQRPRHRQQRRQARAVVGHPRAAEAAVRLHRDLVLVARREHRIEVRGQRHERPFASGRARWRSTLPARSMEASPAQFAATAPASTPRAAAPGRWGPARGTTAGAFR